MLGYDDGRIVVGISDESMDFCLDVDANKSSINVRECMHCVDNDEDQGSGGNEEKTGEISSSILDADRFKDLAKLL